MCYTTNMRNARKGDSFMEKGHVWGFAFTNKEVDSFFEKYPDCKQKIETIVYSYFDLEAFEKIFIRLNTVVKGTILENSLEFTNINSLKESLLLNTKAELISTIIRDLFFKNDTTEINQHTIFLFISAYLVDSTFMKVFNTLIKIVNDTVEKCDDELYYKTKNFN